MTATVATDLRETSSGALVVRRALRSQRRRRTIVATGLVALVALVFVLEVALRSYVVPLPQLLRVLQGELVPGATFIVWEDTLPRAVTGVLVGLAFGVSGATCQSLFRNPLASPDVVGVTGGACAAAVLAIVLGAGVTTISVAALAGAMGVALLLQGLSRRDRSSDARLVLVGIGVAAALGSVTSYLLTRTDLQTAAQSLVWVTGSLGSSSWERVVPLALALVVLLPLAGLLARQLRVLETGEETAAALGVSVQRSRGAVLLCAVALAAVATAAAGPIAYVAFLSGPIARRLLGGTLWLPVAGLAGAALVLGGDWLGAHVVPGTALPVGVVTGAVGAPFLLLLLVAGRAGRRTS